MAGTREGVILGTDSDTDQPLFLADEDRRLGMYVLGAMGMGKSTFMLNQILQDIEAGHGLAVIDPEGDLIADVLARREIPQERLFLLDPTDWEWPFGLNLFEVPEADDPITRSHGADYVMSVFKKLWGDDGLHPSWGPRLDDLLDYTTQTFIEARDYTLVDVPLFLEDEEFRAKVLTNVQSDELLYYWENVYGPRKDQATYREPVLNKVRRFTRHQVLRRILGQNKSTLNVRQIMDEGKVLLLKLPEGQIGDEGVTLLGLLLTGQILRAAFARSEQAQTQRRSFSFYADEYHRFATTDFAEFFSRGRKYGVQTVVAHQFRDQLSDREAKSATLNVSNKVVFRISGHDAQELRREFVYTTPKPDYPLVKSPLEALQRKSHVNPVVRAFIEGLQSRIEARIHVEQHFGGLAWEQRWRERQIPGRGNYGKSLIDQYFTGLMDRTIRMGSPEEVQLVSQILMTLAEFLGETAPEVRPESTAPSIAPDMPRLHAMLVRGEISNADLSEIEIRTRAERREYLAARDREVAELKTYQEKVAQSATACAESLCLPGRTPFAGVSSGTVFQGFAEAMVQTGRILAAAPLYEINVYGVDPVPHSEADLVGVLSNLPKATARARVQQGNVIVEHLIHVPIPPPAAPQDSIEARKKRAYDYAHRTYTRNHQEVDEEIRQRQSVRGERRRSVDL